MATPNPKYGISSQFNPAAYRNAIHFVMEMGQSTINPPVFHFNPISSFTGRRDSEFVPFNPAESVTRTSRAPVSVPCVVEFSEAAAQPTAFGALVPARVTITLLDEDYATVKGADWVIINSDKYVFDHEPPDYGLFSVGLHTLVFVAENET